MVPDPRTGARSFVALYPDAAARERLHALATELAREAIRARLTIPADLHLTLAFIGELDARAAQRVAAMLAALDVAPFDWTLDRVGSFGAAKVVWAGGAPDPRLQTLAQRVRAGLDALGLAYDTRPLVAHVTLLRGTLQAQPAERAIAPPIHSTAGRPVLLRSDASGGPGKARYHPWIFDPDPGPNPGTEPEAQA